MLPKQHKPALLTLQSGEQCSLNWFHLSLRKALLLGTAVLRPFMSLGPEKPMQCQSLQGLQ